MKYNDSVQFSNSVLTHEGITYDYRSNKYNNNITLNSRCKLYKRKEHRNESFNNNTSTHSNIIALIHINKQPGYRNIPNSFTEENFLNRIWAY